MMSREALITLRDFCVKEVLKDGREFTIRAVRPDDRQRLRDAFRLLEPDSIYTRFFSTRVDLGEADLERTVAADFVDEVALVATIESTDGEVIIASGRYVAAHSKDGRRTAEVAFVVEEDYQGLGIASRLLFHLTEIARSQGVEQFEADVLNSNAAMLAVFRKCGFPTRRTHEDGIVHLSFDLNGPASQEKT